ncbi:transketolase [Paenibacillus chitinolyticus]|uniref:transketolase n=1 Tax=Paenibacillus chitinolyticus TaxID=79263 RepID=UPI0036DA3CF6
MTSLVNIRTNILKMITSSSSAHVGTCMSIVEILYTLYFKVMKHDPLSPLNRGRDKLILSKGHGSAALYAVLAEVGYFPTEYLKSYYVDGGILPAHLDKDSVPGVEVSTGSLGHGLSIGVGMALANKGDGNNGKIFVILGDGECNEGSVWEAVMLAASLRLENLIVVVDYNKFQGLARTNDVIDQSNMAERWRVFGWDTYEVDGHNIDNLMEAFNEPQTGPKAIIAHTLKGKGISYMEDKLEWHYKTPTRDELIRGIRELKNNR